MEFVYVFGEENKEKMLALGYKLMKENAGCSVYIFKNKDKAMKFGADSDLDRHNIKFVMSNTLTF